VELLCQRKSPPQLHYEIDFDSFADGINPSTRLFMLCHPQNPTGREFTREELMRLAAICVRNKVLICSDEIHCDLLLDGTRHIPLAALAPEISSQCITLMAPSKTYNIPGLGCSFAIIQNPDLRKRYLAAGEGLLTWVNAMGLVATEAAYRQGEAWLMELQQYLTGNRDFLVSYLEQHLPQLRTTVPEATYLAWLDCRDLGLAVSPHEFFLKEAKVAFNDGVPFGPGGKGFVRLNFGCPRSRLVAALESMREAVEKMKVG
jgi:cystathionine beta-lyase